MPAEYPQPVPPKASARKGLAALLGVSAAASLVGLVAHWEGKSNDPYRDIVGVWTVCYGETQVAMRRYTDAQCSEMLDTRLADYAGPVLDRNPELRGHDNQVVAASSLAYNIGVANYRGSTVARRFSAGDWKGACNAMLAWNRAGGKVVAGLANRRAAERAVCLKGLS